MQIIGFNLTKISIQREEALSGNFKVTSKIDVKNISEEKIDLAPGKSVAKLDFEYSIDYEPKIAELKFKGFILLLGDPKEIKDTITDWKKKNTLLTDIKVRTFNTIFHKCNIKAIQLEDELGLPPHIQMPKIKTEDSSKKATYTG